MKRLEAIAMQDYGFDYADELAMKKEIRQSVLSRVKTSIKDALDSPQNQF